MNREDDWTLEAEWLPTDLFDGGERKRRREAYLREKRAAQERAAVAAREPEQAESTAVPMVAPAARAAVMTPPRPAAPEREVPFWEAAADWLEIREPRDVRERRAREDAARLERKAREDEERWAFIRGMGDTEKGRGIVAKEKEQEQQRRLAQAMAEDAAGFARTRPSTWQEEAAELPRSFARGVSNASNQVVSGFAQLNRGANEQRDELDLQQAQAMIASGDPEQVSRGMGLLAEVEERSPYWRERVQGILTFSEDANRGIERALPTAGMVEDSSVPQQVAQALGSTGPYLAAGVAGGAVAGPVGAFGLPAAVGAVSSGGSLAEEARQAGADLQTQQLAGLAGLAIGASEGFGVPGNVGRAVTEPVRRGVAAGVRDVVQDTARGMAVNSLEEGVQEGAAELARNVAAAGLFDPDRNVAEGVVESALLGAAAGGLLGSAQGLGGAAARSRLEDPAELVRRELVAELKPYIAEQGGDPRAAGGLVPRLPMGPDGRLNRVALSGGMPTRQDPTGEVGPGEVGLLVNVSANADERVPILGQLNADAREAEVEAARLAGEGRAEEARVRWNQAQQRWATMDQVLDRHLVVPAQGLGIEAQVQPAVGVYEGTPEGSGRVVFRAREDQVDLVQALAAEFGAGARQDSLIVSNRLAGGQFQIGQPLSEGWVAEPVATLVLDGEPLTSAAMQEVASAAGFAGLTQYRRADGAYALEAINMSVWGGASDTATFRQAGAALGQALRARGHSFRAEPLLFRRVRVGSRGALGSYWGRDRAVTAEQAGSLRQVGEAVRADPLFGGRQSAGEFYRQGVEGGIDDSLTGEAREAALERETTNLIGEFEAIAALVEERGKPEAVLPDDVAEFLGRNCR